MNAVKTKFSLQLYRNMLIIVKIKIIVKEYTYER